MQKSTFLKFLGIPSVFGGVYCFHVVRASIEKKITAGPTLFQSKVEIRNNTIYLLYY